MSEARGDRVEFRCSVRLKELLSDTFQRLAAAESKKSAPIAWCTSVGPVELLYALGFEVYFPENHGAMLGASRTANDAMGRAHALGYSQETCSYLTSDIGAYLAGTTPLQAYGLSAAPRADVMVYNTNQCRDVKDWFEFYGREWSVPVIGVDSVRSVDDVTDPLVDSTAAQIESLIPVLEKIAGSRLRASDLEGSVRASKECSDLWKKCLEKAKRRPSPITFFDATIQMAPAVILRCRPEAADYYRVLLQELVDRIEQGIGAVAGERYRLYWDGMPVWGRLREHASLFRSLRTCIVASTYCNSWIFDALDPKDPIRSMARASIELFIARSEGPKERAIQDAVEAFQVDGIVFHDSRTCPHNSNTRYGLPRRLLTGAGIPSIILDGDHNDMRCYSAEQSLTSLEGFIEQLEEERPERGSTP